MSIERQKIYLAALLCDVREFCKKYLKKNEFEDILAQKLTALKLDLNVDETVLKLARQYAYSGESVENKYEGDHLRSVFDFVELEKENSVAKQAYYFPMKSLELKLETDLFPKTDKQGIGVEALFRGFLREFKNLPETDFTAFSETLLYLMHKHFVNFPVNAEKLPDVSLFDFAKNLAAFAVIVFDFKENNKKMPEQNENPALLIGADISGIQKFIYDIISKNAAKNLKGRSFYLQLMIDSILKYTLQELKLFPANVVYSSGGGFFVLAPNNEKIKEELLKIEEKVSVELFKEHKTLLFVAFGSTEISHETLTSEKINESWILLMKNISKKKSQRYANKLVDEYKDFFDPIEQGGESKENRDSITGEEFERKEKKYYLLENNKILSKEKYETQSEKGVLITKSTAEQIWLGKDIRKAKYRIISNKDETKNLNVKRAYNPLNLGFYYHFLQDAPKSIPENSTIISINSANLDFKISKANSSGFAFYGGNDYPIYEKFEQDKDGTKHYEGEPLSFDKLMGNEENGFKRLGVLRMDVDNLGQIFMSGLKNEKHKLTFSRYSTLSRNLDYFFTGYLNKIQEEYKDLSFILYSGGDDLFILGKWDLLINMAKKIRDKFSEWTCNNKNLGLSGGIALVGGKFPILKSAELAGDEEKNAKNYENDDFKKDAFSIWNYALSWKEHQEFDVVLVLKNKILAFLPNELPKSFITNVSAFNEQRNMVVRRREEIKKGSKKRNINESWQWQMAYQLARFEQGKSIDVKEFLDKTKVNVFTDTYDGKPHHFKYRFIELLNVAARWAELEYRTNQVKK